MNPDLKYAHLFDTDNINKNVRHKSVKAGLVNIISQGLSLLIALIRAAILARLLSPKDYGIFTMVIVVASFAVIFKDLGLSTATIREKTITHAQVSNLFWINALIGLTSMTIVVATSPITAWFYHDARLVPIAVAFSIAFLFGGLTVQHQALLKRQMQFDKIAYITIFSSLASSILGVIIAWWQKNYWALVWMQVAENFFLMIGSWYITGWTPGLPDKKVNTRKFLKIGLDVAGLNAFSTITDQIDKIIIGKLSDAVTLGLYSKGQQVPTLISGQFRLAFFSVAMPALSALQGEKDRFAQYYYKFLSIICWITMPLSAFCFVFAEEIILLYFGQKWAGSVIFMRIFAAYSFLMPAITTLDQIPLALGYSRRYLRGGIIRSISLVTCVIIAAPFYGVMGVALCVPASNLISFIPFSKTCLHDSPVTRKGYYKTIAAPMLISLLLGGLFYFFKSCSAFNEIGIKIIYMSIFLISISIFFLFFDFFGIGCSTGASKAILTRIRFQRES
jgi:PST family polysaccharide transporter